MYPAKCASKTQQLWLAFQVITTCFCAFNFFTWTTKGCYCCLIFFKLVKQCDCDGFSTVLLWTPEWSLREADEWLRRIFVKDALRNDIYMTEVIFISEWLKNARPKNVNELTGTSILLLQPTSRKKGLSITRMHTKFWPLPVLASAIEVKVRLNNRCFEVWEPTQLGSDSSGPVRLASILHCTVGRYS